MRNSGSVHSDAFNDSYSARDVVESLGIAIGLVLSVLLITCHLFISLSQF